METIRNIHEQKRTYRVGNEDLVIILLWEAWYTKHWAPEISIYVNKLNPFSAKIVDAYFDENSRSRLSTVSGLRALVNQTFTDVNGYDGHIRRALEKIPIPEERKELELIVAEH